MREVCSRVDGGPIATILRLDDLSMGDGRTDFCQPHESLQVAVMRGSAADYAPHRHVSNPRTFDFTQEMWICLDGTVRADLFDMDGTKIIETQPFVLNRGDLLIIHRGGHGYHREHGSVVIEAKPGPYLGREVDKVLL